VNRIEPNEEVGTRAVCKPKEYYAAKEDEFGNLLDMEERPDFRVRRYRDIDDHNMHSMTIGSDRGGAPKAKGIFIK